MSCQLVKIVFVEPWLDFDFNINMVNFLMIPVLVCSFLWLLRRYCSCSRNCGKWRVMSLYYWIWMWFLGILLVLGSFKKECRDSLGKLTFFVRQPYIDLLEGRDFTGVRMYVYPQYELGELFKIKGSNDAMHY